MMMETEKSQDFQLANWRTRRSNGVNSIQKPSTFQTQEEPISLGLKARKKSVFQSNSQAVFSNLQQGHHFVLFRSSTD